MLPLIAVAVCAQQLPAVHANDNRTPAGSSAGHTITVRLVARAGSWRPDGPGGAAITIAALGEAGRALSNPAPLIRVASGATVDVSVRNALADTLFVHDLATRPSSRDDPLVIPPGAAAGRVFLAGAPGTYLYWAATTRDALARRRARDTQMNGALVVDSGPRPPRDRVFVMSLWADSLTVAGVRDEREVPTINGLLFPFTDAITTTGDTLRWRWINASDRTHPMHLHGFYFRVDAKGDGRTDTAYAPAARRYAVTETALSQSTFAMTWSPDRPGNWLFHCHVLFHIAHDASVAAHAGEAPGAARERMSGLVLALHVRPASSAAATPRATAGEPRRLRLVAQARAGVYGRNPGYGFVLQQGAEPAPDSIQLPGPPIVVTRGRPVEINVVNHLAQATIVHWHGIELESAYDGVPNMSGDPGHLQRSIPPGDSFLVRFTPPRAGTFMYHTHVDDAAQLQSGLYGPLIVLDSGATYDTATDHVLLLSDFGPGGDTLPPAFNGRLPADTMELAAGVAQRLRFIIIPAAGDAEVRLTGDSGVVSWRPLAKDGRDLPDRVRVAGPARQYMAVGETYDFELPARRPGLLHVQIVVGDQVLWTAPIRVR